MTPHLSIVSPVYKAEKIVAQLVSEIKNNVKAITEDFDIILVEDGSPDNSWDEIEKQCKIDARVKGIKLSRNFGQHYAITAGLDHAIGQWVIVMDCDLQDRPEEIKNLYKKAQEGFDIVLARRMARKDRFIKRISSKLFYFFLSYLTGTKQDPSIANFGIFNKKVIIAIMQLKEPIRFFPTMYNWVGFKKCTMDVAHDFRYSGKTTYNWQKLLRLSLDIMLSSSDKPIRLIVKLGLLIAAASFFFGIRVYYGYVTHKITVPGYTSIQISIWFIGGMTMAVLGLIGLYVGKIFEGVKNRPIYIVTETQNLK